MSADPKDCPVMLLAVAQLRLLEERRLAAEQERQRRAEEEERRRQARLTALRSSLDQTLRELTTQVAAFSAGPVARFIPAGALEPWRSCLDRLNQTLPDEDALRRAILDAEDLRRALARLQADAEAAALAAGLAEGQAAGRRIMRVFESIDGADAARFDPAGRDEVRTLLARLRHALTLNTPAEARHFAEQAQTRLDRHREAIAAALRLWNEARDRAATALAAAADRLAGLRADAVFTAWRGAALDALQARLAQAEGLIPAGQFDAVHAEDDALRTEADAALAAAQELQLNRERQQHIAEKIAESLTALGFDVPGTPSPIDPRDPASATVISAHRVDSSGALLVSVLPQGDVQYTVSEFPRHEEVGPDGEVVASCDEAEEEIERLHDHVNAGSDVRMGTLTWPGKGAARRRNPRPSASPGTSTGGAR